MISPLSILRSAVIVAIFAAPPAFACPEVSGGQATGAAATPADLVEALAEIETRVDTVELR